MLATRPVPRTWYAALLHGLVCIGCLVLLSGCGDHHPSTDHGVVPWDDEPAETAQLAQSGVSPTCTVSVLRLPRDQQRWGGVWNDAVAGYFMVENAGRTTCELPRPSRVVAATESGTPVGFDVGSLNVPALTLDPGDRAQVQVSSPYDCGRRLVTSTAFALSFPTGTLHVPGAHMAVQCGGALVDFSARTTGASGSGTTSIAPAARLRATISQVPGSVTAGDSVPYVVTLTNPTPDPITFDHCPSYQEGIKGRPSSVRSYQLNCGAVTRIAAHSSVRFAIQLPLPDHLAPGTAALDWKLQVPGGSIDTGQFASAGIRIE